MVGSIGLVCLSTGGIVSRVVCVEWGGGRGHQRRPIRTLSPTTHNVSRRLVSSVLLTYRNDCAYTLTQTSLERRLLTMLSHSMRSRVYVTVRCPSVRPSLCLSRRSTAAAAAGGFAAEVGRRGQQISIDSCCCRATCGPRKFWSDCKEVQLVQHTWVVRLSWYPLMCGCGQSTRLIEQVCV